MRVLTPMLNLAPPHQGPVQMMVHSHNMDKTEARSIKFTEQESFWTLPLHETSAIVDVAVTQGKTWVSLSSVNENIHM